MTTQRTPLAALTPDQQREQIHAATRVMRVGFYSLAGIIGGTLLLIAAVKAGHAFGWFGMPPKSPQWREGVTLAVLFVGIFLGPMVIWWWSNHRKVKRTVQQGASIEARILSAGMGTFKTTKVQHVEVGFSIQEEAWRGSFEWITPEPLVSENESLWLTLVPASPKLFLVTTEGLAVVAGRAMPEVVRRRSGLRIVVAVIVGFGLFMAFLAWQASKNMP